MIFKIDIDCVIRDILTPICDHYNKDVGLDYNKKVSVDDIFDYDLDKVFPEIREYMEESAKAYFFDDWCDVFDHAKLYPKAKEALDLLHEKGHRIILVTNQFGHYNKVYTMGWLNDNHIYYDDICFTADKWLVKGDILIDDNPAYLSDEREDALTIKIIQPYNKDINCSDLGYKSLYDAVVDNIDEIKIQKYL